MTIKHDDYLGRELPSFAEPARAPAGHAPLRKPGSVRRTMSIEVVWPEGVSGPGSYWGRARDIWTAAQGGNPVVLAEDRLMAVANSRKIVSVVSDPPRLALGSLAGASGGGHLRGAIDAALPEEKRAGSPLYLLLDDMAGATLISAWAFAPWNAKGTASPERVKARLRSMEGVCIGFRSGSSALETEGNSEVVANHVAVLPLPHPDDPVGWHEMIERDRINFRRARRIDVWRDGDLLRIDSMFQDSAGAPGGGRVAIHQYRLTATADASTQTLLSIEATPGTLPFRECLAAPVNLPALLGTPLVELRSAVLNRLRKTAGCTHLNDMVRALAEVPMLAASAGFENPRDALAHPFVDLRCL